MQLELVGVELGSHHTVIQVVGVGGGGNNAVQRMIESGFEGVQFVMANTDLQALERFQSPKVYSLPLGEKITGGLGAGGNPEVGREAAEEDEEQICKLLADAHMVFVTAGMGGGTGTGGAPVIARAAKEMGKLCVGVVTMPFHFEGQRKYQFALKGVEELRKVVDTLIVIPNQLLLDVLAEGTSVREAFLNADEVLRMGVEGIADLITQPGDINVDFNDVCTVMRDGGEALMGIGISTGDGRAENAASQALENPLLNGGQMQGATGLLVQITADESFSLSEYSCIMNAINGYVDTDNAIVISGIAIDSQKKDEIKVTVIATGFPQVNDEDFAEQSLPQDGVDERKPSAVSYSSKGSSQSSLHGYSSAPQKVRQVRSTGLRGTTKGIAPNITSKGMPESPLRTPLSTPVSVGRHAHYSQNRQPRVLDNRSKAEAGQAAQMRAALQDGVQQAVEPPDRMIYHLNDEDMRLAEEQLEQVSNTELQLLFSENANVARGFEKVPDKGFGHKGHSVQSNSARPAFAQADQDLYVPTLLRRKARKR